MNKHGFLIDMDGVIYRGSEVLPGGIEFINFLKENEFPFLFLTNNSKPTPKDIKYKLTRLGIEVNESNIYTSAMATGKFIGMQKENSSAYILGEGGLLNSLHDNEIAIDEMSPDYVIVGEGRTITLEMVEKAIDFILDGAKLIATNMDPSPRFKDWVKPGTKAVVAMIEEATGVKAFSVGKPSPIMMRYARKELSLLTDNTTMIGDTMETDIVGGVSMGYKTILTLTGNTSVEDVDTYPYQPNFIVENIGMVIDIIKNSKIYND